MEEIVMEEYRFHPLVEGYLSYIFDVRRCSRGTVKDVRCTMKNVTEYMARNHPGKELWHLNLEHYMSWVGYNRDKGTAGTTMCNHLSHMRGFLDYAWRNGRVDRNVLDGFTMNDSRSYKAPRVLSLEEAQLLIENSGDRTRISRRHRMIVLLLYGCGLRTGELCSLNVQDIDHEKQDIYVRKGKGDIQRRIPVPDGVWTELLAYLRERGGKLGALFKTEAKGRRMNVRGVDHVVREAVIRANLSPDITPKVLRHSFATHLMDAGVDLGIISSLMGHKSPRETGVYLHALEKVKNDAIDRLSFDDKEEEQV